jgi:hypothetical protein
LAVIGGKGTEQEIITRLADQALNEEFSGKETGDVLLAVFEEVGKKKRGSGTLGKLAKWIRQTLDGELGSDEITWPGGLVVRCAAKRFDPSDRTAVLDWLSSHAVKALWSEAVLLEHGVISIGVDLEKKKQDDQVTWARQEMRAEECKARLEASKEMLANASFSPRAFLAAVDVLGDETFDNAKAVVSKKGRPTEKVRAQREVAMDLLVEVQEVNASALANIEKQLRLQTEPYLEAFNLLLKSLAGTRARDLESCQQLVAQLNRVREMLGVVFLDGAANVTLVASSRSDPKPEPLFELQRPGGGKNSGSASFPEIQAGLAKST